jgi:hypothetical protein
MEPDSPKNKAQIVYFSHGGGLLPILGDPGHKAMIDFMTRLPALALPLKSLNYSNPLWST